MRGVAIALFALLALVACEHQVTAYPEQPRMTQGTTVNLSSVEVVWHSGVDSLAKSCDKYGRTMYGCAYWGTIPAGGVTLCTIHALKPADFNDSIRLAILGHELFHCLGANHSPHG